MDALRRAFNAEAESQVSGNGSSSRIAISNATLKTIRPRATTSSMNRGYLFNWLRPAALTGIGSGYTRLYIEHLSARAFRPPPQLLAPPSGGHKRSWTPRMRQPPFRHRPQEPSDGVI